MHSSLRSSSKPSTVNWFRVMEGLFGGSEGLQKDYIGLYKGNGNEYGSYLLGLKVTKPPCADGPS